MLKRKKIYLKMYLIIPIFVIAVIVVESCYQMKHAVDDDDDYEPYED